MKHERIMRFVQRPQLPTTYVNHVRAQPLSEFHQKRRRSTYAKVIIAIRQLLIFSTNNPRDAGARKKQSNSSNTPDSTTLPTTLRN